MAQEKQTKAQPDWANPTDEHHFLEEVQIAEVSVTAAAKTATFQSSLDRFLHVPSHDNTEKDSFAHPASSTSPRSRKRGINEELEESTAVVKTQSLGKKRRQSSKYAPPEKYAHLSKLTDIMEPNLVGVFVGFNPGVTTATKGHAYAHPSNMFWKLLHSSGITDVRFKPEQDVDLPRLCSMGNTNLVERPSKDAGELSKQEMAAGTPILEEKIRTFRPESVCIVGKSIWQSIWRWRYKREIKKDEFHYGWQDAKERMGKEGDWPGAWVFVATATSGLAANLKPHEKEAIWKPYGEWVQQRRDERRKEVAGDQ